MVYQIISAAAFLLALLRVIMFISPQWSERYGRSQIAHAQALRDAYAFLRAAIRLYRGTYRSLDKELERVTY